ncbi:patatin-like phospholipase family protein, partial [Klebsiella pneumoniae]|nr:patatin-like phospholipase family protein [Klebsiella pneumoniae]
GTYQPTCYIGGMQRLLAAGQVPDYMIGSSFGSIIGSLVARELPVPIDEYAEWAKTVSYRAILGPERRRSRHGLAGMFTLRFDQFAHIPRPLYSHKSTGHH